MGFELHEVDVTFRPELLVSKGIRALPVIEIGDAVWVGNGTSQQLHNLSQLMRRLRSEYRRQDVPGGSGIHRTCRKHDSAIRA